MRSPFDPSVRRPEPAPATGGEEPPGCTSRLRMLCRVFAVLMLALLGGLVYRQLFRAVEYAAHERRQNLRWVAESAPRGVIYDREHRVLAGNRTRVAAALNLGELRGEFRDEQRVIIQRGGPAGAGAETAWDSRTALAVRARRAVVQRHLDRVNALIGRHTQLDAPRLERHLLRERMRPFVLVDDLSADEAARLTAALKTPGPVRLLRSTQRWYPRGGAAAHVLGRVRREMTRHAAGPAGQKIVASNFMNPVGIAGIEKQYDAHLQGRPGGAVVRIDAWGFPIDPPLEQREATPGSDLVLSLDIDLQLAAERAMAAVTGSPRGAAVALDVATGEVLVLASQPGFDLSAVSPELSPATKQQIDAAGGWFNRATQGLYPPGSTFKIFTALAALRRGTLHPDDVLHCAGFYDVGGRRFPCHQAAGHGDLSLHSALAHSCNVFACQAGLAAGPEALAAEARRFHLGEPTGIDLPSETRRMLVPDPAWKLAGGRGPWTAADTANLAIGQGFLRCSPLQAACAIASLARRETLTVPTLLHQPGRHPTGDRPPEPLGLADRDYAALIEGLRAVIETGIGRNAQLPGVSMAGKTGTAQVTGKDGASNIAWFVAFAPVERPKIAIAVALEGGRPGVEFAGAEYAAPVVREIAGTYFDQRARSAQK
jgi:penicillin-binding protein 2